MTGIPGLFLLESDGQPQHQNQSESFQQQQSEQHHFDGQAQAAQQNQSDNVMIDAPAQHSESIHKDSEMMDVETTLQHAQPTEIKREAHQQDVSMDLSHQHSQIAVPEIKQEVKQEPMPEVSNAAEAIKREEDTTESKVTADTNSESAKPKQDEEMGETAETEAVDEAEPEFEFTSSDEESDSDSSDDSDDDSDIDPSNARDLAKRLLEELDDEDTGDGGQPPKTLHELDENELKVEIPDITITPETKMEKLGSVQTTVDNLVLINAATDGKYRVLDEGSVLATDDRVVIGVVADVIGRVEAPLYTVRFNTIDEIQKFNLVFGKDIYYLPDHSTYVFTKPIMAQKGTDASNLYDEEVPESEQELSDDEAEAARKAAKKKGGKRGNKKQDGGPTKRQETRPNQRAVQLPDGEPYVPLHRPTNLPDRPPQSHGNYGQQQQQPSQDTRQFSGNAQRNSNGWQGQGRNDRGGNRNQRPAYTPPSRQQSTSSYEEPYQPNRRPSYGQQQTQQAYSQPQSAYQPQQQYPVFPQFTNTGYNPMPVPVTPTSFSPPPFNPVVLPPGAHINPAFLAQMQAATAAAATNTVAASAPQQTPSYPFPQQASQQQSPAAGYSFNPYGAQSPPQTPFQFGTGAQGWPAVTSQAATAPAGVPTAPPSAQGSTETPGGSNDEAFKKIQENLALLSSLGGVQ
ncbi:NAF1-domain-containing protein [Ascobolus immersus RN42]|uniref:H/ACA ribonucleoprotein complex non-core subunit NAF1 n=1 Tax=Ascobolus immersus RN42 TaxID=1160509 RepID=A0A3N4I7H5_ASCIM|nr:NAF1-domain-containing protein [Ascobolus immersus RN42]